MDADTKCFLAAAESGSFSAAAKELNIPKQEISRQILRLEEELRQELFDRVEAQVSLNAAGVVYYSLFRRLNDQFQELKAELEQRDTDTREIRVGCMKVEGVGDFLSDVIQLFCEENPEINLVWEYHSPEKLIPMLEHGDLDMAVVFEDVLLESQNHSSFKWLPFHQSTMLLLVSKDHPRVKEGATAADFICEPCYVSYDFYGMISFIKSRLDVSPALSFDFRRVKNSGTSKIMVENGQGVTVCSDLSQWSHHPRFVTYPIASASTVLCVWRRDETRAAVLHLERWIEQSIRFKGKGEQGK